MERTLLMTIAFDGTGFHGYQTQPGVRTVQAELEASLRRVLRHPVDLVGCSRTDAGVHAAGLTGSFTTTRDIPPERLRHAIVSRLPEDIGIVDLREVPVGFDARREALCKLYQYRIYHARTRPVAQLCQRYVHHWWRRLDVDRMRQAAPHFVGTMDFSALAGAGCQRKTMVRTVLHCGVETWFNEVRIQVLGTGFLYKQVRNMVGTLVNVGCGLWEPDRVRDILVSRDRRQAGPTAPAKGLCLQWVRYPPDRLKPPTHPTVPGAEAPDADVPGANVPNTNPPDTDVPNARVSDVRGAPAP